MAPTHKPLIDYFQDLNKNLVDFPEGSFFRMDLGEIMGALRYGINFPALAVESHEGAGDGSIQQNSVIGRTIAFTVYMNPNKDDYQQQNEMLDQCERIGLKILARMRHDATIPGHLLYNRFKVSAVNYMKVGPVFTEMLYGYRFLIKIEGSESLKVDPEDWRDLE